MEKERENELEREQGSDVVWQSRVQAGFMVTSQLTLRNIYTSCSPFIEHTCWGTRCAYDFKNMPTHVLKSADSASGGTHSHTQMCSCTLWAQRLLLCSITPHFAGGRVFFFPLLLWYKTELCSRLHHRGMNEALYVTECVFNFIIPN